jgi:NADH dehydrogenase
MRQRIVIAGGGFAGLNAARGLKRVDAEVTVVDRRNFHLFQPLLYQVATGGLSPGEITAPIRHVLSKQKNTRVLLGEIQEVDAERRVLKLHDGTEVPWDTLIAATGSTHHYFGHPEWAQFAPGLKTIEDATAIRTRVLLAFERAELEPDAAKRAALLTFVVVGGGPTGVELAGALGEISRDTLEGDFRRINPAESQIFLIEGADRLLPPFPPELSRAAEHSLIGLGVQTRDSTTVTAIDADGVTLKSKSGEETRIASKTVLWAAGVQASPLGSLIARATGAKQDKAGRIEVQGDLTIAGRPDILVLGDLAHVEQDGAMVPGVAPAAIQMGKYAAKLCAARVSGKTIGPFHYFNKGILATIGRARAVADIGKLHFSGFPAWLTWLFVHLLYIVGYENRLLVAIQWAGAYFTFNRGARLITGDGAKP